MDDRFAVAHALAESAPHQLEYRLVLPDGRVRRIRQRAEIVFSASSAARMVGLAEDITELGVVPRLPALRWGTPSS